MGLAYIAQKELFHNYLYTAVLDKESETFLILTTSVSYYNSLWCQASTWRYYSCLSCQYTTHTCNSHNDCLGDWVYVHIVKSMSRHIANLTQMQCGSRCMVTVIECINRKIKNSPLKGTVSRALIWTQTISHQTYKFGLDSITLYVLLCTSKPNFFHCSEIYLACCLLPSEPA